MPTAPDRRIHGLDTLRAAAIALVFMYHYQVFVSGTATFGWLSTVGWTGVDLFFVLSGYLIGNQICGALARGNTLSLRAFYARRFLRTLPNFYVVLALYFAFPAVMGGRTPPPLWKFLTFTQNWHLQPGTAFSHAWSLCIEEQFYLLLPATALALAWFGRSVRGVWILLGGAMLIGIAWRSLMWSEYGREAGDAIAGYYPHVYYATACRIDELLPGVAIALLKNFHPQTYTALLARGRLLLAVGLSAVGVTYALLLDGYYIDGYGYGYAMTAFGYPLVAVSFALLVLAALSPTSPLRTWRVPGAASLALWSYAFYLLHKPIAAMLRNYVLAPLAIDTNSALAVGLVAALCLLGAWLLHVSVERPFLRLRDRWVPAQEVPRAPPQVAVSAAA